MPDPATTVRGWAVVPISVRALGADPDLDNVRAILENGYGGTQVDDLRRLTLDELLAERPELAAHYADPSLVYVYADLTHLEEPDRA